MKTLYKISKGKSFHFLIWRIIFCLSCVLALPSTTLAQTIDTVFSENWESGIGSWYADNGVWEVGIPTVGPTATHSGQNCAGTVLGDNYPDYSNTRLISPQITLPSLSANEKLQLKVWQWFRTEAGWGLDQGFIQIKVGSTSWETIAGPFKNLSPVWTQLNVDISAYADKTVRVAFHFISDDYWRDNGWYVDDILINKETVIFTNPEDFELGVGNWSADNGLWEVGKPTVGPSSTHSGQNCAGTVLGGNYNNYDSTRFISPEITIISVEGFEPELFFWHWFRTDTPDKCYVQVKVGSNNWVNVAGPYSGISPTWSQGYASLSAYIGQTIQIAFYFTSDGGWQDNGWYIDDIRFTVYNHPPVVVNNISDIAFAEDNGPFTAITNLDSIFTDTDGSLTYTAYSDNAEIQATIQNKSAILNSSQNYFGSGNIRVVAIDDGGKSVSDTFQVVITPIDDAPGINLPDSITFKNDSYVVIQLWEFASDVETVDSLLTFECGSDTSALIINHNEQTDVVTLSAPQFVGSCSFLVTVRDDSNAVASDTISIVVQLAVGVKENDFNAPATFALFQNYPNPFNPSTIMTYQIPEHCNVSLKVYEVLGREIKTLVNEEKPAGKYEIKFDASEFPSGVYYYRLSAGDYIETKKMIFIK